MRLTDTEMVAYLPWSSFKRTFNRVSMHKKKPQYHTTQLILIWYHILKRPWSSFKRTQNTYQTGLMRGYIRRIQSLPMNASHGSDLSYNLHVVTSQGGQSNENHLI